MNRNLKLKLEIETRNWNLKLNLKLKLRIKTWNSNLKLNPKIKSWNWILKLNPKIKSWNWILKLKPEIENWNWNLNFFGPMGLFLASRSVWKTFLEPTNVDYQFLFWKYSPIFLFLIRPNFGPFCTFWALRGYFFLPFGAIFGVKVRLKNIFGTY